MRITRWAGTGLLVLGLGPLALASSDSVTITNRAPRSTWKVVAVPLEAKEAKDEVQESKVSQAQSSILGPGQSRVITLPGAAQVLYRLVDGQDKVRGSLVVHRPPPPAARQAGRASTSSCGVKCRAPGKCDSPKTAPP
jgi:hypothetical protein